jgi:hypothetical protein
MFDALCRHARKRQREAGIRRLTVMHALRSAAPHLSAAVLAHIAEYDEDPGSSIPPMLQRWATRDGCEPTGSVPVSREAAQVAAATRVAQPVVH